jgi:hypothetical protein
MRHTHLAALLASLALSACGPEWDLGSENGSATRLSSSAFSHAIEGGGRYWVVLDREPDASLIRGEPELIAARPHLLVRADAVEGSLPASILGWRGRAVRLHDDHGALCSGIVTGFAMVGRLWPHDWDGSFDEEEAEHRPLTGEIWQLATPVLAGEVLPSAGRCTGARWARATDEPEPRLAAIRPASPRLADSALSAFRRLGSYAQIEHDYLEPEGGDPVSRSVPWESYDEATPSIVLVDDGSASPLVVVSASAGAPCGGFSGQLTAVFRLDGKTGRLEWLGDLTEHVVPDGASDLDGDGVPELLFDEGLLHLEAGKATRDLLGVPFYGCPC